MMILVVGDVEPKEVFGQIEESIDAKSSKPEIKRIFPEEPKTINRDYVEQKLAVAMPMFQMGFKDNDFNSKGIECLKREVAVKLILEMIMAEVQAFITSCTTRVLSTTPLILITPLKRIMHIRLSVANPKIP